MRSKNCFALCFFLVSTFNTSPLLAKDVHLVPPTDDKNTLGAWEYAVATLKEGDTVFLEDKVYHLGKSTGGFGGGAVVFMDERSPIPAVIKFEKNPAVSRSIPNLSLRAEFDSLEELGRQGFSVAKPLELGPKGLTLRQELGLGVTVNEYFRKIFLLQPDRTKRNVIESLDRLFHSLAEHHVITADLRPPNIMIDPATGKLTIIDPGPINPKIDVKSIFPLELAFTQFDLEPYRMFADLHPEEACSWDIKSLQPGK